MKLVLYLPVLHQGYVNFLEKHRSASQVWILGSTLIKEFTHLEPEIRACNPSTAQKILQSMGFNTHILGKQSIRQLQKDDLVMPDEAMMRRFAAKYLSGERVRYAKTFLRWDESHVTAKVKVKYDRESRKPLDRRLMALAQKIGEESSDWWRHVGAIAVRGRSVILVGYNHHVPSAYTPYMLGDIRDFIPAGVQSDISSARHAEKTLITLAARKGVALANADLYVTVFPCADCAKYIALAGFRTCYFKSGHASFHGEEVLKSAGVEIVLVQ